MTIASPQPEPARSNTDDGMTSIGGEMADFISKLPKAELHLHIEGTLEPELMFRIAERNGIKLKHDSVERLRDAYNFNNLQEFLDVYYEGADVLRNERDFRDLTLAYLERVHSEGVVHVELFFDPQTHTDRGVPFDDVVLGIHGAMEVARRDYGMSLSLIMCFLRHLDESAALDTLDMAMNHRDLILGVGLDSSEFGHPPSKFERVFARAREAGFVLVSHAGEEGPPEYIHETLDVLNVQRIDHGIRCLEDPRLIARLASEPRVPLTLCPLSNLHLRVIDDMSNYPLRRMMDHGLLVTINSDDPAYFGGYVNANYEAIAHSLGLDRDELCTLAKNGFAASFAPEKDKAEWIARVDAYRDSFGGGGSGGRGAKIVDMGPPP